MSTFCIQCGAALKDSAKFCKSCGAVVVAENAPIEQPAQFPPPPMPFPSPPAEGPVPGTASGPRCPSCGRILAPGKKFCAGCGNAVGAAPIPPVPMPRTRTQRPPSPMPPQPGFAQAAAQSHTFTPRAATPVKATALITGVALLVATSILSLWPLTRDTSSGGLTAVPAAGEYTQQAGGGATTAPQQPEGVKTDVTLAELVGEWEGTIQFTRMDGFEDMPEDERPDNLQEIVDTMLAQDHSFTLEITEDGEWYTGIDVMAGLNFDSAVAKKDSGGWYTPNELLLLPFDGSFSTSYTLNDDEGTGTIAFSGTVFDEDELRMEGKLHFEANAGAITLIIEGDYSVILLPDADAE